MVPLVPPVAVRTALPQKVPPPETVTAVGTVFTVTTELAVPVQPAALDTVTV